jgi:Transposase DDE domain group 1
MTITYQAESAAQAESVSPFLMLFLEYARESGVFRALAEVVKVKMKSVVYGPLQKAQTIMASVVMGCGHTKAINEVLGEELGAANYLQMDRFPDQSQINRYLTRFEADNVAQLGEVHLRLFEAQSLARRAVGQIVVDIDQCGLVVSGKTYEWARKGYFPRKRGEAGYQLSLAYIGAYEEVVNVYLDPGNSHCQHRLRDLLADIERGLLTNNAGVTVIRRLDGGYDSASNRALLADLPGYFILKGGDSRTAARLARPVPLQNWWPVAPGVHGTELTAEGTVRRLVYEFCLADGRVEYALLYTNLPTTDFGVIRAFTFYNERTTIEAFFASARHVFNIQSMRSRQFNAIAAFLRFVALTHNLIHWVKHARLTDTPLEQATTSQLVLGVARVRAHLIWDGHWHLSILCVSRWATLLLEALTRVPRLVQLEFPFARLYKT